MLDQIEIAPPTEVRIAREDERIRRVSAATVEYMYDHGRALEERLGRHARLLDWLAEEEHDLFNGMRLSVRRERVAGNLGRAARRNERLGLELLRRRIDPDA